MEEYQHHGMARVTLQQAIHGADRLIGLEMPESENGAVPIPPNVPNQADNDQALAELQAMMRGIGA